VGVGQCNVLDRQNWIDCEELRTGIVTWIERVEPFPGSSACDR